MGLTRYAVAMGFGLVLVGSPACARPQVTTESRPASTGRSRAGTRSDVLGVDELRRASGRNALEIIQQLRPLYLRSRGPLHTPTVFVDLMRRGGVDELRAIPASSIAEVRYLDGRDATQRFGSGYSGGIIHISTTRSP